MARSTRRFWQGFAAGAAAGFGSLAMINLVAHARRPVVRLEKSLQIGRPVAEVFQAWTDLERLPQMSELIQEIRRDGNRSHWRIRADRRQFEWDAEIEQFIPNEAVGWKSRSGPKHTGRITFSSLGGDTLVHVVMNYYPRPALLRPFFPPLSGHLDNLIEQALRDFKAALEGKGQEDAERALRATGTFGPGAERPAHETAPTTGFRSAAEISAEQATKPTGNEPNPVEFTRPPETKS